MLYNDFDTRAYADLALGQCRRQRQQNSVKSQMLCYAGTAVNESSDPRRCGPGDGPLFCFNTVYVLFSNSTVRIKPAKDSPNQSSLRRLGFSSCEHMCAMFLLKTVYVSAGGGCLTSTAVLPTAYLGLSPPTKFIRTLAGCSNSHNVLQCVVAFFLTLDHEAATPRIRLPVSLCSERLLFMNKCVSMCVWARDCLRP